MMLGYNDKVDLLWYAPKSMRNLNSSSGLMVSVQVCRSDHAWTWVKGFPPQISVKNDTHVHSFTLHSLQRFREVHALGSHHRSRSLHYCRRSPWHWKHGRQETGLWCQQACRLSQ